VYFSDSDSRVATNNAENTDKVPQFTEIFLQVGMGHLRIADAADLDSSTSCTRDYGITYTIVA
jgi:hypothetical protein